jgi:hypothetical protein
LCSIQDNAIMNAELINNPNIHAIFDHTKAIIPTTTSTFLCLRGNRSQWLLDPQPLAVDNNVEEIDAKKYDEKVQCVFNLSDTYYRMFQHVVLPLNKRKYDVVFLGNINYNEKLTELKQNVITHIHRLGEKYNLNVLATDSVSFSEYNHILANSKIFISSYEWGEFSTKDYDCINYGTHVIKSNIFFEACPNIYEHMDSFRLDFSDFDDIVMHCLHDLPNTQIKVNKARTMVHSYKRSTSSTIENILLQLV